MTSHRARDHASQGDLGPQYAVRTFRQAVAAYAQRNFSAAAGYLLLLDAADEELPEHIIAAHASLRAALAARARNWNECCDWYGVSLAQQGSPPSGGARVCLNDGCEAEAHTPCGQCGRFFCPSHGARSSHGVLRCLACLDGALVNLAQAAVLSGRTGESVRILRPWARADNDSVASFLLECLQPGDVVGFAPELPAWKQSVAFALHQAAGTEALTETGWEVLGKIGENHGSEALSDLHRQITARHARALTREGRRSDAWRIWRRLWQSDPLNLEVIHGLGLAALRVFADDEETEDCTRASAARHAIACWAAVLHSPAYRNALAQARGEAVEETTWTAVTESLCARIGQVLRDDDLAAGRPPVAALETAWNVERGAARRWAALENRQASETLSPGLFGGPVFLDEVASIDASRRRHVAEIHAGLSFGGTFSLFGDPDLTALFSPEAPHTQLLWENRLDEVIDAVETAMPDWRATGRAADEAPALLRIMSTALVRRAQAHGRAKRWREALRDFEEVALTGTSTVSYADDIGSAGIGAGLASRGAHGGTSAQAGLLERALQLAPGHQGVRENLASVCVRLAERAEAEQRPQEAERRYARACELAPEDRRVADALHRLRHPGAEEELGRLSDGDERIPRRALRELLIRYPSYRPARQRLADDLHAGALRSARKGKRARALALMEEAAKWADGEPDERFTGEGPEIDVAYGLWLELGEYDTADEQSLRVRVDALRLSISYRPLAETDEFPEVLTALASRLHARGAYNDVIALKERQTEVDDEMEDFYVILASAYEHRAALRGEVGDTKGARRDARAAAQLRAPVQGSLFSAESQDGLW
ncbi:hypothetical protein [Streptomyces sp. NBC_01637]|uniref:hypothetical protein n=1 Tax=unclassified Streptomyces TaxID=2593676 RepID=UPI00386592FA|nr:hypothetical protein OH719_11760 [Streptomyces sp. NBC_01653]WTD92386.1 hypothetical protein OG891_35110 [Streptomyces sp. NBC_01637]